MASGTAAGKDDVVKVEVWDVVDHAVALSRSSNGSEADEMVYNLTGEGNCLLVATNRYCLHRVAHNIQLYYFPTTWNCLFMLLFAYILFCMIEPQPLRVVMPCCLWTPVSSISTAAATPCCS